MNATQLVRANELQVLIKQTTNAVMSLQGLRTGLRTQRNKKAKILPGQFLRDDIYNFSISEYPDGSGMGADLVRYEGNDELLEVIIQTLNRQIQAFNAEFEKL